MATENIAHLENGIDTSRCEGGQLDREKERRHHWTVLPARTKSSVCRNSVFVCAFIVCVHLVLVYTIDVGPVIDRLAHQQVSIIYPSSSSSHQRAKRDLTSDDAGSNDAMPSSANDVELQSMLSHVEQGKETMNLNRDDSSSSTSNSASSSSTLCRSGHIQGFTLMCETQPCLRRLQSQSGHQQALQPNTESSHSTSPQVLRRISRISGRLDAVHFSLIPFITHYQWSNGLYGAVGEFGAGTGKFTSLLSTYTDVEIGEKLFVCDCFNHSSSSSSSSSSTSSPSSTSSSSSTTTGRPIGGLSSFQIFLSHMKDFGFEETDTSGVRKLHLYRGESWNLDRNVFTTWDIPQFRLISIDADHDRVNLLSDLETATCLLRDGGIIVVNGVDDSESKQLTTSTLVSFLQKHGHSALTPILSAGNKLYLTTTNWRRKYIQALTSDVILQQSGLIQSAVMEPFSTEHLTLTAIL